MTRGNHLKSVSERLKRLEQKSLKREEHRATEKTLVESRLMKGDLSGFANQLNLFSL